MSFPSLDDVGKMCLYRTGMVNQFLSVLILDISRHSMDITSINTQWVDVLMPDGQIRSVAPWQCKRISE